MKKLYFYRFLTVILIVCLFFSMILYRNKSCTVIKNETKKIVNPNYVFLGDSITNMYDLDEFYEDYPVVNSGKSGNRTWDIKDNLYERVYRYNPSRVVLLIGINNFLFEESSVNDVYKDIRKMVKDIKKELPNTTIYIQSIYPINKDYEEEHEIKSTTDQVQQKIVEVNDKLKEFCYRNNYTYIDMYDELIDKDNNFNHDYTDDGLHPNENGYKKITKVIKKAMDLK